jgi:nucleolar protein 56
VDEEGNPLPSISGQGKPTLCEGQLDEADPDAVQAATLPVEEIDGPVLLVSGSEDPVWPATRLSGIAAERLRENDFEDEFEHLNFEDASHFLTPPFLPKVSPAFGGSLEARANADPVAWSKAIEYLRIGTVRDSGTGGDGA